MLRRRSFSRRLRDERGAVAVIVSILALVLFGIGALAIDLGNGFARKRGTQSDADFAALAGGALLNGSSSGNAAALSCAYQYLLADLPVSDGTASVASTPNCTTAVPVPAAFTDGDLTNGEICFPSTDVANGCANDSTTRIKVVVPPRTVQFGLANAIGFSSTTVTATASVELRSPAGVLTPFALPAACAAGQQVIKDPAPGGQPSLQWEGANGNNRPTITGVAKTGKVATGTNVVVAANQNTVIDITGTNFDATTQVALVTTSAPQLLTPVTLTGTTTLTVTIPSTLNEGRYYLQVGTANKWSDQSMTTFVDVGSGPNVCDAATGDFGIVDTPRKDVSNGSVSQALFENIVYGADHNFKEWGTPPLVDTTCKSGNTLLSGAVLDNDPTINNANCLDVLNGNKVSDTTSGMITGSGGVNGRLNAPKTAPCARPNVTVLGVSINNDVLSCFLVSGATIAELNGTNGQTKEPNILTCDVVKSPRFMFVPVLDTSVNPQNGWWRISHFVGAFLTDELPASTGVSTPATVKNGIDTTNSQIKSLTSYVFPRTAVPTTCANIGATATYLGFGPAIPVLVN